MKNKIFWSLLIALISISTISRLTQVFNAYNFFFTSEQGMIYLVTKGIVIDHHVVLAAIQGGFGGFLRGPGFNYLLAIPFVLTGGDPFGGRLFMLFVGVLTVALAFVLSNRMFGLRKATIISFLLAISPTLKDYAGIVSQAHIIPPLTVLFIYFVFRFFQGQKKFFPVLVLLAGLMTHFETATAGILLTLLFFTGIYYLIKKTIPIKYYLLSIGAFVLTILPLIVFDLNNNFYNAKGVLKMLDAGKSHASNHLIFSLGNIFSNRFEIFAWNFISTFSANLVICFFVLIFFLIGLFLFIRDKKVNKKEKTFILYLGSIPIASFLLLMIYPSSVQQWWLIHLNIIYCFMVGIIFDFLLKKNRFKFLTITLLFILSIAFISRTYFIYKTQFAYPPNSYIKEAYPINYIFSHYKDKPFNIIVRALGTQENYDYLIWWYGQKYHYQPGRKTEGLYFIIIEPNLPFSVEKNPGNIIETKKMPNGFIIEERLEK